MIAWIDSLHDRARANPLLYRVVLGTRCLFAMAFIPTGWIKLLGERFTAISTESPIGAFFEALHQTGDYWRFLGATQLVAGVLMLIPRTATLGAVIFFPVALNIFVITVALEFRGTQFLTAAMLLGATALLAWDWDRLRGILTAAPPAEPRDLGARIERLGPAWERAAYVIGTIAGLAFFGVTRGLAPPGLVPYALGVGAGAALVALWGLVRSILGAGRPRRHGQAR